MMTFEDYRRHDALGLADLVRRREVSPSELLDVAIARAEAVNPTINAIVHPLYDRARQMAARVEPDAPFAGVPFLLKDLGIELAGAPLSKGCRGLRRHTSTEDSEIARRLRQAGLLFLGKTNTPEFGLTPYTEPRAFGPTRNPWNPQRSAGGSSGGSAAAVAAGIAPMATASDGGGSIRIPASCCGLFGLKPSRARVSLGPQHAEGWAGAIVEHCVSRSVRDSAALLDILQGHLPGDPYLAPAPAGPYLEEAGRDPGRLRIGFATTHTLGHAVETECVAAVTGAAGLLSDLGHHVEEVPLPYRREDLTEVFIYMIMGETAATIAGLRHELGRPATRHDVEPTTWALGLLGRSISAERYVTARRRWNEVSRRAAAFHQQYDLLLTPTVARTPFPIGDLQPTAAEQRLLAVVNRFSLGRLAMANIEQLAEKTFAYIPYTPIANMTGQPAMSVPLHRTADGLPAGVMFTADLGREDLLFRLAGQLEKAKPWFDNVPEG